ncbi:MAG: DUF4886 domain-containing protein [Clostridia bacterium]|nr:DUF4886 domain-containing protein [Clostridia bacterium]
MNILAIGNSFSQDATAYLYGVARNREEKLHVVNLYIGGCSLERHFRNMLSEERAYDLQINGMCSSFKVSLKEALLNRAWDVVTFQQASHHSTDYETYQPYLSELSAYVRRLCPRARQIIHQTWAYEDGSAKLEAMDYMTSTDMLGDLKKAYDKAAADIEADDLIPSGELFSMLLDSGVEKLHRDTFHASYGVGRYALALLWYAVLTGNSVEKDDFYDTDEPVTDEEREAVINCIEELMEKG